WVQLDHCRNPVGSHRTGVFVATTPIHRGATIGRTGYSDRFTCGGPSTIALCTVGAVLGIPSLGTLFTDGFQRKILAEILTGIILTLGLAGATDGILVLAGKLLMPWRRQVA